MWSRNNRFALGFRMMVAASALLGSRTALAQSFGATVASGNFDGAGSTWAKDDYAVGSPFDGWRAPSAGSVTIYWNNGTSNPYYDFVDQWVIANLFTGAQDEDDEPYDQFGAALAVGDFDHDGYKDLAIGAPWEDLNGVIDAGCVHVLYGTPSGSGPYGGLPFRIATAYLTRANAYPDPIPANPESSDLFGFSLAAGDFNGDGYDDLAIGAPGATVNGNPSAGAVFVFYSSGSTFTSEDEYTLVQGGVYSPSGVAEAWDGFGSALAAGNFNGDINSGSSIGTGPNGVPVIKDLAVSATGQTVNGAPYAGNVTIYYGRAYDSFNTTNNQVIDQSTNNLETPEAFDGFGQTLAAGDFDASCGSANPWTCGLADDLAIGVPDESIGDIYNAGIVHVLYGKTTGLSTTGAQVWWSNNIRADHQPEGGGLFGYSLAAGNLIHQPNGGCQGNSCSPVELAIGEPGRSGGDGAVYVLEGNNGLPLTANHTRNFLDTPVGALYSRFGSALAIGQIGPYPGQNAGSMPAADLLIGAPAANDVRLWYGDDYSLNNQVDDIPWPW